MKSGPRKPRKSESIDRRAINREISRLEKRKKALFYEIGDIVKYKTGSFIDYECWPDHFHNLEYEDKFLIVDHFPGAPKNCPEYEVFDLTRKVKWRFEKDMLDMSFEKLT